MNSKQIPSFVWISVVLVLILSAFSIRKRTEIEASNRSVAIASEFETIEALAGGQGVPVPEALQRCQKQGLRALVINEETVADLIVAGRVSIVGREGTSVEDRGLSLRFQDPSMMPRVKRGLEIRFGQEAGSLAAKGNILALPPVSALQIRSTPVGLNPFQVANARAAELEIIGRFANTPGLSAEAIEKTLQWAREDGVEIYLPLGDEVLGFRVSLDHTIAVLRREGILYASAEFGKIAGDTELVSKGKDIVVRLHSAQIPELDKLTPFDAMDRYVKAARERNMRVLLVRPLSLSAQKPADEYDSFVFTIARQVVKNGQSLGRPHAFTEPKLPKWIFPLLAAALAPIVWFVACGFVSNPKLRMAGAGVLGLVVLASISKLGQEISALLGSMAFPLLGFNALDSFLPKLGKNELVRIFLGFWLVSAISIVGGVYVAAMLNSLAFYIHAAEFQAVKVSVFLPIILVGVHYFFKLTDWQEATRSPITWGKAGLGLGVGLALAIMIARTGNDTGVGPSEGEMVFRSLLDRFLYVRPRTKEFMVGHPILIVGIGMLGRLFDKSSRPQNADQNSAFAGWTVLALMVGAVGQTSVVNTLCHIHIPFFLSFIRDVEGMALGCIIGVVIWVVVRRWAPSGE